MPGHGRQGGHGGQPGAEGIGVQTVVTDMHSKRNPIIGEL